MLFTAIEHHWLSPRVRESCTTADIRKRVYLSISNVFGTFMLGLFGILDLSGGRIVLALVKFGFIPLFFSHLLLLRYYGKSRVIYRFGLVQGFFFFQFIGICKPFFLTVGSYVPSSLFWSFAIPLIAFYLLGRKSGLCWTASYLVSIGFFLFIEPFSFIYRYNTEVKVEYLGSFILISILAGLLESLRAGSEANLERKNRELEKALENVKTLSGLVPICSSCRKIRDDEGYWKQLEEYLQTKTDVQFTHGLCDDCAKEQFPEIFGSVRTKPQDG